MLLPYHRALGSLFSSENCVGVMSKSGCQFTVLYYKDVEYLKYVQSSMENQEEEKK